MKHLLKFWGFFRTGSKEHHKDNEPVFYGTSHVTTHNIHSSSASGQIKCAIVINIWFLEEIHLVSEHTDAPEELRLQSAPLEVKKTVCQLPRFFSLPFRLPPLIIIFISIAPNQSSWVKLTSVCVHSLEIVVLSLRSCHGVEKAAALTRFHLRVSLLTSK